MLRNAAKRHGLPIVTELMDVRMLDTFLEQKVDVIQIGTRNMQNFDLLKEVGTVDVPVVLKRGMSATISEWLMAAEYIAAGGNHRIILCERGIRTYENAYRNVLDVTAVAVLKKETHLPVIVDPSHAGGKAWMVPALSCAAVAAVVRRRPGVVDPGVRDADGSPRCNRARDRPPRRSARRGRPGVRPHTDPGSSRARDGAARTSRGGVMVRRDRGGRVIAH
jgi:hypothetical protein